MSVNDWAMRLERGVSSKEELGPGREGGGVVGGDFVLAFDFGVAFGAGIGKGLGFGIV